MKIAIVGLPLSGKTTLFRALAAGHFVDSGDAHLAAVPVPDPRLDAIAEGEHPKKVQHAVVTFVDVAAMRTGEDAGARIDKLHGLIGDADALMLVVQAFGDMDYEGRPVEPARALGALVTEIILTDMAIVESRLGRLEREHKAKKKGDADPEWDLLKRVQGQLEASGWARALDYTEEDARTLRGYGLLTMRQAMAVFNFCEADVGGEKSGPWIAAAAAIGLPAETACATLEVEIAELADEERAGFLAEYGLEAAARERLVAAAYRMLDIVTFFTVNQNEARAWTVSRHTKARQAAGRVHSDLEKGFVRAEVVAFADYETAGNLAAAKQAGKMHLEGHEYEVRDGDIVQIRFTR
jgi:hypothetical protein